MTSQEHLSALRRQGSDVSFRLIGEVLSDAQRAELHKVREALQERIAFMAWAVRRADVVKGRMSLDDRLLAGIFGEK